MSDEKIVDVDDTYDKEKLGLFFDPYIFNELKSFRSYGIDVSRLIIVFWILVISQILLMSLP